jgi:hypothetical protein
MNTIIAHPNTTDKVEALKAFLNALKISFEVNTNDKPYNPEFVAKIHKSKKQLEDAQVTRVKKEDIKNLLGL